jgi:predicted alpha/beta-hydrolase family hydrolase
MPMKKFILTITSPFIFSLLTFMALLPSASHAEGTLIKVPTRTDVKTTLFWEPVEGAKATVFLFPGGGGGFGKVEDGKAMGGNFLVRSAPYFLANGFNVAIFGRPNDMEEIGWRERMGADHLADVRAVLEFVKQKSSAPVWIVGTSRGTVSATAMAITVQDPAIAGLVLTSSVVKYSTPGAVPTQNLSAIKVPVLVYHHAKDACKHCQAHEAPAIIKGLSNAPIKKLMVVDGGGNPTGDVCAGQHWHGFIGMEKEAVNTISAWIRNPTP